MAPELVAALREDVRRLEAAGSFAPSGVATAGTDGVYGTSDRRVCVLDEAEGEASDARSAFEQRLGATAREVARALGRPTLACAERYYSLSAAGSTATQSQDRGADFASFFIFSRALTCVCFCHLPSAGATTTRDPLFVSSASKKPRHYCSEPYLRRDEPLEKVMILRSRCGQCMLTCSTRTPVPRSMISGKLWRRSRRRNR